MSRKVKILIIVLSSVVGLALIGLGIFFIVDCSGCNKAKGDFVLEKNRVKLEVGTTVALVDDIELYEGEFEWYSFDDEIAAVDEKGTLSGISEGKTVVVVTVGDYTASCDVTVTPTLLQAQSLSLETSAKTLVLNAESQYNTATLGVSAFYNGEGVAVDTVEWSSSDTEAVALDKTTGGSVVVTSKKNGTEVYVSAKLTYNGITATAVCKVVSEKFAYILPKEERLILFAGDSKVVDFDLYVAGALAASEKSKVVFSSSDNSVVTVDNAGKLTVEGSGSAVITLTYGTKTALVSVTVGTTSYINTASQLVSIDGANSLNRYILNADINLSGYYNSEKGIGAKYFINSFGGSLYGNGYTVYGLNRYASVDDTGFDGVFNSLTETAVIKDVKFISDIDTNQSAILLANVNNGVIENCLFNLTANSDTANYSIFGVSVGKVKNSSFTLNIANAASAEIAIADIGYGKFENCLFVAPSLTKSTFVNGLGVENGTSAYFTNSYYYESVAGVSAKTAFNIIDAGKGEAKSFGAENNIPTGLEINGGQISFSGKQNVSYSFVREAESATANKSVGENIQLSLPDKAGSKVKVYDSHFNDVTASTFNGSVFTPAYAGDYTVLYTSENNGAVSGAVHSVRVVKPRIELDKYFFTLKAGETATITAANAPLNGADYSFYSDDTDIASVGADGVITAAANGETTVRVVGKASNVAYLATVKVLSEYVTVGNADELIGALKTATDNTYIVMTGDITIPAEKITYEECHDAVQTTYRYYLGYVVKEFGGTLDGQGYKLTVKFDNTQRSNNKVPYNEQVIGDDVCGMFYKLTETSEIKNINYDFEATFVPNRRSGTLGYSSALAYIATGEIRDCYLKAHFKPTQAIGNTEAILGRFYNVASSSQTAYCYNVLFDIATTVNGTPVESGYAVRFGSVGPYAIDCALIRNGTIKEFYGDRGYHGSVVCGDNNNSYKTIYDFINGIEGYNYNQNYQLTRITDGVRTYAAWSNKWSFSFNEIRLCGKKIADVNFNAYNAQDKLEMTLVNGSIVLDGASEAQVFVDGVAVGNVEEGKFDLYGYFSSINAPFGKYELLVTNGAAATCAVYEIIAVDNANFYATLSGINTVAKGQFKQFVLTEDITLSRTNTDFADTDRPTFGGDSYYVFTYLFADLDGRGHSITFNYNANTAGKILGGLIYELYGLWQNVEYKFNATYVRAQEGALGVKTGGVRYYFANIIRCGGLLNVVMKINSKATDASGNEVQDTVIVPSVVYSIWNGTSEVKNSVGVYRNIIVVYNGGAQSQNEFRFANNNVGSARYYNVAVVAANYNEKLSFSNNNFLNNCYYLSSVNTLINGGAAKVIGDENKGLSEGEFAFENVLAESGFVIDGEEIKLCGKTVIKNVTLSDDTMVDDGDII